MWEYKSRRGELCCLIIILESLVVIALNSMKIRKKIKCLITNREIVLNEKLSETNVYLNMKGSSELITAFSSHGFVLGVVESVQSEMLNFVVIFFEEKMVSQMIENHWIGGIDGISFGEHLNSSSDAFRLLLVESQDRKSDQSADALAIQL